MASKIPSCPLWETPVEHASKTKDGLEVNSPRAGGRYVIDKTAQAIVKEWTVNQKILLTSWLVERRRFGVPCPKVKADTLDQVKKSAPLSVTDRVHYFLRYASESTGNNMCPDIALTIYYPKHTSFMQHTPYSISHNPLIPEDDLEITEREISDRKKYGLDRALAHTASTAYADLIGLYDHCRKKDWFYKPLYKDPDEKYLMISLTVAGREELEEWDKQKETAP